MKIDAKELSDALAVVNLVPCRAAILPSEFIQLICDGKSMSLAMASQVMGESRVKVQDGLEFTFYAERKLFTTFVTQKEPHGEFEFEFSGDAVGNQLKIKHGRRKALLHGLQSVAGYGKMASVKAAKSLELSESDKATIKGAVQFAPQDPTLAHLTCVYISDTHGILASNTIAIFNDANLKLKTSLPFPLTLPEILNDKRIEKVHLSQVGVLLELSNGFLFESISDKCRDEFPHAALIARFTEAKKYTPRLKFSPKSLYGALERLAPFVAQSSEAAIACSASPKNDFATLRCETPQGHFQERVKLQETPSDTTTCEWPLVYVTPFVEMSLAAPTLTCSFDDGTPYHFRGVGQLIVARRSKSTK